MPDVIRYLDRQPTRSHATPNDNWGAAANAGQGSAAPGPPHRRKGCDMRRIILTLGCAAALVGVMAAPVSAGSSGVTLATGSFTLVGAPDDPGVHRTFSFVVVERRGEVTGQAQWITFGGEAVRIDINCFTRVDNQALVG